MPQEQQNIRRWLVRLTGPIFIEMVLIILLGIVDTVMLSQCSDNTVAAVGVVVQLLNMIFSSSSHDSRDVRALFAVPRARQMDNVFRAIGVSLAFNMMMGVIVSAAPLFRGRTHPAPYGTAARTHGRRRDVYAHRGRVRVLQPSR